MQYQRLEVRPLTGALGAEVFGVDLARQLNENAVVEEIHRAFLQYGVIFFREQQLTPDQHIAFGQRFGTLNIHPALEPLEGHPEILVIAKETVDTENIGNSWHTDLSCLERPPLGSILYAKEVPSVGGDTMFASMYLAYENLSLGMREVLDQLVAVHSAKRAFGTYDTVKDRLDYKHSSMKSLARPEVETISEHPVVRTHPQTGRKALYVNRGFTSHFKNMTKKESRPILEFLYGHASKPEFTCRFRWEKNSIAFWDNRCVHHYAVNDYQGQRRLMHRVTIDGDRPY